MDFSIAITIDPPTATLTAHGELDIFTAHEVARQLSEAVGSGCRRVLVDVAGVTFVDASALGVLAWARHNLVVRQGDFGFVATSPPFRRLCAMTGLDREFALN
jgi:anti-sigma B factor antagonist